MKLVFCRLCEDVFKPGVDEIESCKCGNAQGFYSSEDGLTCYYTSSYNNSTIPLGFANSSFAGAFNEESKDIEKELKKSYGHRFEAFIIPWNAETMIYVNDLWNVFASFNGED